MIMKCGTRQLNILKYTALASVIFFIAIQVYYIIYYWGMPQYGDAAQYTKLAIECYDANQWYPTEKHVQTTEYLFNPGFVNYLILQLKLFGTLKYFSIIGLFLNLILLSFVYFLASRYHSKTAGLYSVIFFCLLTSNWLSHVAVMTELIFCVILYGSFLCVKKNHLYLILCALLIVMAGYIRPITFIFVPSALLYMLYKKYSWKYFVTIVISYLCFNFTLNFIVRSNTAARDASGTTGGWNILVVANDDSHGHYVFGIEKEGHIGYVKEQNVYAKDSIRKVKAVEWIKDNKLKYLSHCPIKLFRFWWGDYYWNNPLDGVGTPDTDEGFVRKAVNVALHSLVYYLILILFTIHIVKNRKKHFKIIGILILPILLATGLHMIMYGMMRYHYPYMPILILCAASQLTNFISSWHSKASKAEV